MGHTRSDRLVRIGDEAHIIDSVQLPVVLRPLSSILVHFHRAASRSLFVSGRADKVPEQSLQPSMSI